MRPAGGRVGIVRTAIVVVGELSRSPRMLNHARKFASIGPVSLIGFNQREFAAAEGVRVCALRHRPRSTARSRPGFLIASALRMTLTMGDLIAVLLREKPSTILLQNPPSFPTLLCGFVAAALLRARLMVDWHNYGYSMLALRLGNSHPVTRLAAWFEGWAGKRADRHFCVSQAMQADLKRRFGIVAEVLYDRPVEILSPDVANEHGHLVAVCPAGWTADEDMSLLLDGLASLRGPRLEIHLTGDGPLRRELEPRIAALKDQGLAIRTGFLSERDYWQLICRADLGISMHRSSSRLDLAMKVVDLFSAGVPVCALDYGGSLPEQIRDGEQAFFLAVRGNWRKSWRGLPAIRTYSRRCAVTSDGSGALPGQWNGAGLSWGTHEEAGPHRASGRRRQRRRQRSGCLGAGGSARYL